MKAQDLVKNGTVTLEELNDWIDGNLANYEYIQVAINKATGFESAKLDLNTDDNLTDEDVLSAYTHLYGLKWGVLRS